MKRITIITDSLSMPRDNIHIEDTWSERIIDKYRKDYLIYFFPMRARHTRDVAINNYEDLIEFQSSDLVIIQLGIVDACRRVMPRRLSLVIPYIPLVGKTVHRAASKYHYQLTKMYNCRYVSELAFKKNITRIVSGVRKNNGQVIWIRIAEPNMDLVKKTYNVCRDVKRYNDILEQSSNELGFTIIDPYGDHSGESILLPDGHHLTKFGNDLVYRAIDNELYPLKSEEE